MDEFIEKVILGRTIQAAFQRGNVYKKKLSREKKEAVKNDIIKILKGFSAKYKKKVSEEEHIKNIIKLKQSISNKHKNKLRGNKLRIRTTQKLLNVYIKFLWRLNCSREPVHCPIDKIVLKGIHDKSNWTELKTIREYKKIICKIRRDIGKKSIARGNWT